MKITRVGVDLAKNVFQFMASIARRSGLASAAAAFELAQGGDR